MRPFLLTCLLAASLGVGLRAQQAPVFRGATETVPVYVTVTDGDSRLVTTLTKDDFVLLDNGRKQPIPVFDDSPRPIRLIVMLDISGSMYGNLGLLRAACSQLFSKLRPEDQAKVGWFGEEIKISPEFTNDRAALVAELPAQAPRSAPTPLWTALDAALGAFEGAGDERRVVLVLSDGKDSGPPKFGGRYLTLVDVMERARRDEVMIYSVGLRSRSGRLPGGFGGGFGGLGNRGGAAALGDDFPDPGLGKLALETGGGYFELRPSDDLPATFERVADELHAQYLLGFAPPDRDGKRHKIEVKLVPRGLESRARKNYIAPKGS
ncbi:MAG TPA: VWA domain-containing protein [Vicinamibacterales bacterium]|nr:VWA domain-containing protein [Vicinamibacterales bacterium]